MAPIRALRAFRAHAALAALLCTAVTAAAQQPPAEEPGWAKGRPKTEAATRMAPVPSFPIPTAPDQLPTAKFKLPPGFKVETWASGVLDARELRQGAKGTVFVSTLFVGNKVYAIAEKGDRKPKTIIDKTEFATGIEFDKGALYLATHKQILRYDGIEDKLDNPGAPVVLNDKLPGGQDHSWRYLRMHEGKLYYAVGAPRSRCRCRRGSCGRCAHAHRRARRGCRARRPRSRACPCACAGTASCGPGRRAACR